MNKQHRDKGGAGCDRLPTGKDLECGLCSVVCIPVRGASPRPSDWPA